MAEARGHRCVTPTAWARAARTLGFGRRLCPGWTSRGAPPGQRRGLVPPQWKGIALQTRSQNVLRRFLTQFISFTSKSPLLETDSKTVLTKHNAKMRREE